MAGKRRRELPDRHRRRHDAVGLGRPVGGFEVPNDFAEVETLRAAGLLERVHPAAARVEAARRQRGGEVRIAGEEVLDRQRRIEAGKRHSLAKEWREPLIEPMTEIIFRQQRARDRPALAQPMSKSAGHAVRRRAPGPPGDRKAHTQRTPATTTATHETQTGIEVVPSRAGTCNAALTP